MLDTKIWDKFANNQLADFAIGGPTIELLFNSYNQKMSTNYIVSCNQNGYLFSFDNGNSWLWDTNSADTYFVDETNLYMTNSVDYAHCLLISSPSGYFRTSNIKVSSTGRSFGTIGGAYWDLSQGIRPIVRLKSNIELIDNENGTYAIKNV